MGLFGKKKAPDKGNAAAVNAKAAPSSAVRAQGDFPNTLTVDDVYSITGRGCVVTGQISAGLFTTGDQVNILRVNGSTAAAEIGGIESPRKRVNAAYKGDSVGILLMDITKSDIGPGDLIYRSEAPAAQEAAAEQKRICTSCGAVVALVPGKQGVCEFCGTPVVEGEL
ncbi:EF-Tu/IF-2/RF-3 family GTPase [Leadbettera azotonutricia]|uniref:Translation elongation factor Tu n=1 Tax=Leadbettera azotonutricia (strain ATCC BAA-888 / DSM 13862 / ZAS-9) TaxID=545695 RepID=F5Y8K8_LEAAZ|nr:EF-Tu/IF-2/RF-3 family GTPase [Leadbettera azotonutricia]AEF81679.1 translation elongation factor Tu [Leadbettera azotonutricia ZAS-9]